MNVCGVTFGGYLAKILSFKLGNLLYKSNFYLLSEGTVHAERKNRGYHVKEHEKLGQRQVSKVTLHFVWGHLSRKQTVH